MPPLNKILADGGNRCVARHVFHLEDSSALRDN
jgi:hypothetical protein